MTVRKSSSSRFLKKMATLACMTVCARRGGIQNRSYFVAAFAVASRGNAFGTSASKAASFTHSSLITPFQSLNRNSCPSSSTLLNLSSTAEKTVTDTAKVSTVQHPSYEIISTDAVTEYGAQCTLYRHKKTGAELLSVVNEDDNKVFGITFRTPPTDSTGVPHILEHSVLCGSRKYTTKEPFVQLLQGSLQTFLNAFTYPDRTCYVLASQNTKDFYNLINVYADAVFHPRAIKDPMVHAQEGWHLELEDKNDPLTYKGVVYNEMKGVYSSPDSLLGRESQRSLFPDNTYSVDSGGDPVVIPDLSYEDFRNFHAKFYHPANSRIYFWGDDDVITRLNLMDEYLGEFGESPESKPGSVINWQSKTFTEPQYLKLPYPIGEGQPETHMVNVNWLLNDSRMSPYDELLFSILDQLLMGTPQSILYKTLMESGLGTAITGGGLSDELLQSTFSVGLKGVDSANVEAVQKLIMDTLEKVSKEGFSDDDIAASMNTVEFNLREFNTGSFPRGLAFMLGSMSKWIYDESPTSAIKFEEPLAELKANIAKSGSEVFKNCISEYLVKNTHRATIEMIPSTTLEQEQLKEEADRLATIKSSLSDDDLEDIIKKTSELKAFQAAEDPPEARSTIPSLELADLKREPTEYPNEVSTNESNSGVTVLRHELPSTSGIAYVSFGVDISGVSYDDIVLLPLFTRLTKQAGAGSYSDIELDRRIGMYTGGVGLSIMSESIRPDSVKEGVVHSNSNMITKLFINGKATSDNINELFSIMKVILTEGKLDSQKKAIEILKETKARLESGIQGSGNYYANTRIRARYNVPGFINEKMGGISYLNSVNTLLKEAEENWPSVLARLEKIRSAMFEANTCRNGMLLDITGDTAVLDSIKDNVGTFLNSLPGDANGSKLQDFYTTEHPWVTDAKREISEMAPLKDEGFVVATQVSYVGSGGRLFEEGESLPGSAAVVSRFLRTGYLWDHVRVIGGAYGGSCSFDARRGDGIFTFSSYRDPNLAKTLDVYDATADALLAAAEHLENDADGLATAIIGAVGDMDGALSPDQKGGVALRRWLYKESAEERQRFRDEILNTKASDFKAFAERLKAMKEKSVAVVSSASAFEAAASAGRKMDVKKIA